MGLKHIRGSNGNGEAVLATVTAPRNAGSTILTVDSVTNWPNDFIATAGKKLTDGTLDPTTVIVFTGHQSSPTTIVIDSIAPGYNDTRGNAVADVVVLKPTTKWADNIADTLAVSINDNGTLNTTQVTSAVSDWKTITTVPTLNASNGQREYQLKFTGTDYTDRLQPGTKLKIPRTTTAPTQSAAFVAASSQYASKVSPAGLTFSTAFTCEAWVYLNNYTSGNEGIVSKYDGTNGFFMWLNNAGQLNLSASNSTYQTSYQSLPLKQFVHVAGTFSGGTFNLYINGVLVPSSKTGSGTAVTQAGNLQIGAFNSSAFFDGYIAEARVWSQAQTAQNIRDNMNKQLTGSETNLVAYYKLNGNFNDATANANNLTASGGAIATNASNPMNATEYAIVTAVTKPAADTLVTVFTPTGTGIPNETLGTVSYSSARSPYGFPSETERWSILAYWWSGSVTTVNVGSVWGSHSELAITAPTGKWELDGRMYITGFSSTAVSFRIQSQWDSAIPTVNRPGQHTAVTIQATNYVIGIHAHRDYYTFTTPTTLTLWSVVTNGSGTQQAYREQPYPSSVFLKCGYL